MLNWFWSNLTDFDIMNTWWRTKIEYRFENFVWKRRGYMPDKKEGHGEI